MDPDFTAAAIAEARASAAEGGVPVGAALVCDGRLVATGRNRRQQARSPIFHGETDCLHNAGLFDGLARATLITTLSPCLMCSGTIVQFRIPHVVILDAENFGGNEEFLRDRGVTVEVRPDAEMIRFFAAWRAENEAVWGGDIGDRVNR